MIITLALVFALADATVDAKGACMDSFKQVPYNLGWPLDHTTQVVRIDKILSTSAMTPGEVIGFLYTRRDGATFAGTRNGRYMSPASWGMMNQVLDSTHDPSVKQTAFSQKASGNEYLQVNVPADALGPLKIQLEPCVAWPKERPLPDVGP
ncbi:MAG: hypothetical protein M3Z14_05720 [Candidatus Eremiobacteraeota bacterium]|nr:hypothetical protein [Candidatus Eremiobacteraeota bacterium]